jgi:hypothetical protein
MHQVWFACDEEADARAFGAKLEEAGEEGVWVDRQVVKKGQPEVLNDDSVEAP